jgi:hypothetical protein
MKEMSEPEERYKAVLAGPLALPRAHVGRPLAGILDTMRRVTGVIGAALVLLGFLGLIEVTAVEALAHWWFVPILMVPLGFALIWEAQITWPEDGSTYPWRTRLSGLIVGVAGLASAALTRGLLMAGLPDNGIADSIAMSAGGVVGVFVYTRLRGSVAQRIERRRDRDRLPTARG